MQIAYKYLGDDSDEGDDEDDGLKWLCNLCQNMTCK